MTIITLDLNSSSMTNNGGLYTEEIKNLPFGVRVKIIDIISLVSITNASISPFMYLHSNLIQNNSYDALTNSKTNCLQTLDLVNHIAVGGVSTYYTDSQNFQFESVLPQTIQIEKRTGINRTLLIDNVDFHIRICMETID
jgi:hypothetical protein